MTLSAAEVMEIDRNSLRKPPFSSDSWIAQAVGLPCRMASPCEACVDGRVAQGVRCPAATFNISVSPKWRKLFANFGICFCLRGETKNGVKTKRKNVFFITR